MTGGRLWVGQSRNKLRLKKRSKIIYDENKFIVTLRENNFSQLLVCCIVLGTMLLPNFYSINSQDSSYHG